MSGEDQSSLSAHMGSYKNKGTNHEMRDIPSVDDDNEHAWGNDLGESYYQGHNYHLANSMRAADYYAAQLKGGLALLIH